VVLAFDMPARQSLVTELVEGGDLPNAIALNSSIVNAARIIGPAIAGLVVATVGEGICFLINALSYLAVIWGCY
jgi:MFS family permease